MNDLRYDSNLEHYDHKNTLMTHTMELWEKIMEKRLRQETKLLENQFGFMTRGSTNSDNFYYRYQA